MTEDMTKKNGRPEFKVNWSQVDVYLQAHCTGVGIGGILGLSPKTLYRKCQEDNKMTFEAYSRLKRVEGQDLIRARQFEIAYKDKDRTMLIYLGKILCGQSETQNIDLTTGGKKFDGFAFLDGLAAKPGASVGAEPDSQGDE